MTQDSAVSDEALLAFHAGALPAAEAERVAAVLARDPAAAATLAAWAAQDAALSALYGPVAAEPVPERLGAVLRRGPSRPRLPVLPFALAAMLALGLGLGWAARGWFAPAVPADLARAAMRAHATFVVEVAHPVEVGVDDEAHLNRWMSRRLGHEIRPPDFGETGFALLGGRILPADGGTAALYMYENDTGQRITLYVAPEGVTAETAFRFAEEGATRSFTWTDRDLSYAIVGDIPRDLLRRIATLAWEQLV